MSISIIDFFIKKWYVFLLSSHNNSTHEVAMQDATGLSKVLKQLYSEAPDVHLLTSLQARSEYLRISSAQLYRFERGRHLLTRKMATRFAEALGHTPEEREAILTALQPYTKRQWRKESAGKLPSREELEKQLKDHEAAIRNHEEQIRAIKVMLTHYENGAGFLEALKTLRR